MKVNLIIRVTVIAFFALLISYSKVNAFEKSASVNISLSTPTKNASLSIKIYQYGKSKRIGTIKIPIIRRKYFRDERTVGLNKFNSSGINSYFTSSILLINNKDYYTQTILSLSLLRGPPIG